MATNDENSGLIPVTDHELFQATTARGFEPGLEVFGRFRLIRVLGRGGMGIVWLAMDKQLDQEIAIKVLPDMVMHDREAISDMKRETKRSLQLNHHHIVRIYDFNQDEKCAGISMEFVDGQTLSGAKVERPQGCFDVEDVGPWLEQICDALAYAHNTAKIVHRDLKPANIMLSKTNVIKVTDFGIARSISDSFSRVSMRHATSGTMVYMSPQQSAGVKSSPSDDIYALGASIYDLLTGKPPFFSGNIQHQLENVTPPSMAERRAELDRTGKPIPAHWEKAVAACLAKEVSKRPATVRDLAAILQLTNAAGIQTTTTQAVAPSEALEKTLVDRSRVEPAAPSAPAPREPSRPWLSPAAGKWIAVGAGGLVAVAGLVGLAFLIPVFFGRGEISVQTAPPGALVTLGEESHPSPADFKNLWSGDKVVSIKLDGFDALQFPTHLARNQVADLGVLNLVRSTGRVNARSIPAGASFTLKQSDSPVPDEIAAGKNQASGHLPYQSPPLPTGTYQLITTAKDFSDNSQTLEVKPGATLGVVADLVKENSLHLLAPEAMAAVSLGQPIPDRMLHDPVTRAGLIDYYQSTAKGYTRIHEYKLASGQLDHLANDLGVDVAKDRAELNDSQDEWVKDQTKIFNQFLADERLVSAKALLDDMEAKSTQTSLPALHDALAKATAAHNEKIDKTLADITALQKAGKSDEAYQLGSAQAARNSEDARLIQVAATMELSMPSTYDRVSVRFKMMDDLLNLDAQTGGQADFSRIHGVFQKNLEKHQSYKSRIEALESDLGGYSSRIADLRADMKHNQDKANGYHAMNILGILGGTAAAADNSAPGAVAGYNTGAIGAKGASDRESDIRRDQSEISEIESKRGSQEEQIDALKKEYDAFTKTLIGEIQ